eukprot:365840-Chlamydomonas_euryale.AAC.2
MCCAGDLGELLEGKIRPVTIRALQTCHKWALVVAARGEHFDQVFTTSSDHALFLRAWSMAADGHEQV